MKRVFFLGVGAFCVTAQRASICRTLVIAFFSIFIFSGTAAADCVLLLHGLARSSKPMNELAEALTADGYYTVNIDYPSTKFPIEILADTYISPALATCPAEGRVHFVAHSMGGIMVRYWLANNDTSRVGRVVMIAPPNHGSELVDKLGGVPGFALLNGPAGLQLSTAADSVPNTLGPVTVDTGIIAGDASFNPLYSWLIPGVDDGKVSIERTRLDGMSDFIVLHHTHAFIMGAEPVIGQVLLFLRAGAFQPALLE